MSTADVPLAQPRHALPEVVAALRALPPNSRQTIVAYLSDGDYRFDVTLGVDSAVVRVHATLREDWAAGGTWWTSRVVRVRGASAGDLGHRVGAQVAAEVTALRGRFARLLREHRAEAAEPQRAEAIESHRAGAPESHRNQPTGPGRVGAGRTAAGQGAAPRAGEHAPDRSGHALTWG
ncbi:hypothetical protein [Plantactinospora sp. BB1]|uniref:hypothetical protein n=1 Tax=Plantactinospora sp. BB1 TaxID=2071627 RepID=UPI00131EFA05|nr:hypothetical protein [Plantactinospora sp. BB1]